MAKEHPTIIVVKKVKGHGGHHGGAWKVAYADFVTAMMAFFLVMWLVSQGKPIKAAVAGYFRDPGAFTTQHGTGVLPGGKQPGESTPEREVGKPDNQTVTKMAREAEREALEKSAAHIKERLNATPEFKALKDQVEFRVTSEGLRIELVDSTGGVFFESGSAGMRPEVEHIFAIIAREVGQLDNELVIEGHTDSRPYARNDGYGNWELSGDRANAARRVMERSGLRGEQVAGVRGQADRQLKIASEPMDPRNRRVSILVKSKAS